MTSNETKMEPLLSYPYNAFLMLRLEFVQILQDDLQAKLLRIIEVHIETQRTVLYREAVNKQPSNSKQVISIPKDIFVPISYKLFMNDLFDLVTSENTIKKALNQMIECKVIFRNAPSKKRYAAPEYGINTEVLQILLDVLKNPGYQKLIPSILDTLRASEIDTLKVLGYQKLIPSGGQELIPSNSNSSSEEKSRVSEVDTNIREKNITDKNERMPPVESSQTDSSIPSSTPSLSLDDIRNPDTSESVDNSGQDVDKQPSSKDAHSVSILLEHPSHHIANPTIENAERENGESNSVESLTTRNDSQVYNCMIPNKLDFTPEEGQIQEWWCAQKHLVARPPKCTTKLKEYWDELVPHIHSLEKMTSLCEYTRAYIKSSSSFTDKRVHPGNLVDCLDGWVQTQAPPPQPISFQEKQQSKKIQITPEYLASLPV